MTRKVWVYRKTLEDLNGLISFDMPSGAKVLSVVAYGESALSIYVLVDPEATTVKKVFRIVGTGHDVEAFVSYKQFVGTVVLSMGSLVLHVFELE